MSGESVSTQIDGGSGEFEGRVDGGSHGYGERSEQKKLIGYGRKAKRVVLSQIKKAKKRLQRNKPKDDESSCGFCGCWSIGRIPSVDSSAESPTSDPNSSGFGLDSLRDLIEKSDFLLDDCNTHLEVYSNDDNDDDDDEDDDDEGYRN